MKAMTSFWDFFKARFFKKRFKIYGIILLILFVSLSILSIFNLAHSRTQYYLCKSQDGMITSYVSITNKVLTINKHIFMCERNGNLLQCPNPQIQKFAGSTFVFDYGTSSLYALLLFNRQYLPTQLQKFTNQQLCYMSKYSYVPQYDGCLVIALNCQRVKNAFK